MQNRTLDENARIFKALSHPTRLQLLCLIRDGRPCVGAMEEKLGLAQANISQHLSLLRNIGIIRAEREGHQVCYQIYNKKVLRLLNALLE